MKRHCRLRIARDVFRFCAVVLGLGLIFAWLGVYDTADLPFGMRLLFWTTTMAVGGGAAVLVAPFVWGPRFENVAAIFKIAMAAALISIPVTLLLVYVFHSGPRGVTKIVVQFTYVMVISLIVTTAGYVHHLLTDEGDSAASPQDPVRRFLDRLPVKFRTAELYAISSEDHYLRVYTSLGEDLILMRLADAVRELAGADGLQVHRSWWVAKAAIRDEKRVDGRSLLILPDGTEVPVSRSYRARARDAGLVR